MERGGFEPPKAEPADLQSAPFDRFGTSPVRQCPSDTRNAHRTTPHSRSCSVLSPPHPRAGRLPANGCECRMSDCCLFLSACPTCFFPIPSRVASRFPMLFRSPLIFRTIRPRTWSWRWDSNPQPADYKSAALPIELRQPEDDRTVNGARSRDPTSTGDGDIPAYLYGNRGKVAN